MSCSGWNEFVKKYKNDRKIANLTTASKAAGPIWKDMAPEAKRPFENMVPRAQREACIRRSVDAKKREKKMERLTTQVGRCETTLDNCAKKKETLQSLQKAVAAEEVKRALLTKVYGKDHDLTKNLKYPSGPFIEFSGKEDVLTSSDFQSQMNKPQYNSKREPIEKAAQKQKKVAGIMWNKLSPEERKKYETVEFKKMVAHRAAKAAAEEKKKPMKSRVKSGKK
jgi:hypothetical protein